jgi:hypothetical protein
MSALLVSTSVVLPRCRAQQDARQRDRGKQQEGGAKVGCVDNGAEQDWPDDGSGGQRAENHGEAAGGPLRVHLGAPQHQQSSERHVGCPKEQCCGTGGHRHSASQGEASDGAGKQYQTGGQTAAQSEAADQGRR